MLTNNKTHRKHSRRMLKDIIQNGARIGSHYRDKIYVIVISVNLELSDIADKIFSMFTNNFELQFHQITLLFSVPVERYDRAID